MLARLFIACYRLLAKRRISLYLLFAGSLALWAALAYRVKFVEDVQSLLPNSHALKAMNEVATKTKAGDQVIFILTHKNKLWDPSLSEAAQAYYDALQNHAGNHFVSLQLQPGAGIEEQLLPIIQQHLSLFLQPDDYASFDSLLSPKSVEQRLAQSKELLMSPASVVYKQLVATDPIGISKKIWGRLQALNIDPGYEQRDGFLFADSGRSLVMMGTSRYAAQDIGKNKDLSQKIQVAIAEVSNKYPDVAIQAYGGPLVAGGNARQMRTDTMLTLGVSLLLLLSVAIYYFRNLRSPSLILIPVLYGALFGLAMVYLWQGSMALMALGAGAIVLGIAVDFSLHFLSHAKHTHSAEDAVRALAQPLTLGSITTVLAFLILRFAETPILKDFGLFAGCSLVGAALATLLFLPHFIASKKQKNIAPNVFDKLGAWKPERNKWLVMGIFLLTPFFLYWSFKVKFDADMMHLNYLESSLQKAEQKLVQISPGALNSIYVLAKGNNDDEAMQRLQSITPQLEQWRKEGKVTALSNPAWFLPSATLQQQRLHRWKAYWSEEKIAQLRITVAQAAKRQGYNVAAFNDFFAQLQAPGRVLANDEIEILQQLFPGGKANDGNTSYAIAALKVPEKFRTSVLKGFSASNNITIADKRMGTEQLSTLLKNDFNRIALFSSLIVFLALLVAYGRIELALFSFLPMAISWIWILGIMALFNIQFNIVNIIISSLIFGLGDDYSIFTMDGLVEKYKYKTQKLNSVRSAIYISATTTIIGLGVLLLAKHPALKSIALVSVPGMLCVVVVSQTIQPFLFNWFIQHRADKGYMPFTLRSFFISVFAFAYFFTGSLVLTVLGFLFTVLWPFNKEKGKYYLHLWLSRYTWSMMYIMGNVKKRILHHGSTQSFDKPAVYIANHSSFLDILVTTMLTPKMILLTNRWVWKSPVFGKVVKMAEYYPVADGAEDSIEPLRNLVQRGYNIMVFPEGTRSYTDKIHRFKKGAFYLAEKLKLNVVPVVLHGVHYTMSKGDWLLKDGTTSIHIYEPLMAKDTERPNGFLQQTKATNKWMREELERIKVKEETPSYFREQLLRSYTYKGPVLEWYCRIKSKLEGNYELFHQLVPRQGLVYDLGCGYGFLSYMLRWSAKTRTIIGVDYDEDKVATAQASYLRDEHITFEYADLCHYPLQSCKAIIINDVLHYLTPEKQVALLQRCYDALDEGGVLIIRDGVSELQKIKGTKLTEFFSTKVFSFNKTTNELHFLSRKMLEAWASQRNMQLQIIDQTKYTSNLVFVFRK